MMFDIAGNPASGKKGVALVYARVSTRNQEQEGSSLGTQAAECQAYAEREGYRVASTFSEVYSGEEIFDRPELNRLRDEVKSGRYQAVIVFDADRLTRKQGLSLML